ncbi:hypothetical protein SNE40_018112 [Patella caerulea]|uniref:Uncharacterized protein n=1 Tax=Patella caerulea TaxID=87958 RepID=A0AAN8J874_PATCE
MANYNEQYSRKMNIRVLGLTSSVSLNLEDNFIDTVRKISNIHVNKSDIIAIHELPSKYVDRPKPVIIKMKNTECKSKIMKNRKLFKEHNFKLSDDITKKEPQSHQQGLRETNSRQMLVF